MLKRKGVISFWAPFTTILNIPKPPFAIEGLRELSSSILLGGDTNAHGSLWGSPTNNARGDHWEDLILVNDFFLLNNSNDHTFSNHIGESHLDITLCTEPDKFHSWQNLGVLNGSDHAVLTWVYDTSKPMIDKYVRNVANTDWDVFLENLSEIKHEPIRTTAKLEECASVLVDNIGRAFDLACPPKKAYPGRPCNWWNQNLSNLLRKKNLASKEMRKYKGTQKGIRAYIRKCSLGRLFNKHVKIEKEKGWQKFITGVKSPKNISALMRSFKNDKRERMPLLRNKNNQRASNELENLEILRESHFNGSLKAFQKNYGDHIQRDAELPDDLDTFLSLTLLNKAIESLPVGKASGPDGIKNEILKKLPISYREALLEQFRASIAFSFLPSKWLDIETIYINKPGKPDKESPKTYRPIGLSSGLLKLCERLINWRLKTTILKEGIPKQHAFTLNRSTETAISELVHLLEKAKYCKLKALVVSVDIQGAFDNIPFHVITEALHTHGADPLVVKWIDYLSKNRSVFAKMGEFKQYFRPVIGTTQGGLNGPDLWIIALWNIIFLKAAKQTSIAKFADDLISALLGHDIRTLCQIMQTAITEFNNWFEQRGLKISAQKSFCMVFNLTKKDPIPIPLKLGGIEIPIVNEMKYLGVIIDKDLSWKPHIKARLAKAKRDLLISKRLVSHNWGLAPDKVIWIYESIVRPALDYACHVWTPNTFPVWLSKALDSVQRLALVCATSCIKSTPTRALERLANIIPLTLHLQQKAMVTVNRIANSVDRSNWDGIGKKRG